MSRISLPGGRGHGDLAQPLTRPTTLGQTGAYLRAAAGLRYRVPPPPNRIARRRFTIALAKWILPLIAVVLLASVALWPEVQRMTSASRLAMSHISGEVEGGKLIDARYNGVDEKGRPYTLTAATAWQIDPERVGLTMPKGDITLENGTWLMLTSKTGTYMQHLNQLDLVEDVTLYRDDGTTMHTHSCVDRPEGRRRGGLAMPMHVEGPFGVLDAKGFTVMDKGNVDRFPGSGACGAERGGQLTAAPSPRRMVPACRAVLMAALMALGLANLPSAQRSSSISRMAARSTSRRRTASNGGRRTSRSSPAATPRPIRGDVTVTADRLTAWYRKKKAAGTPVQQAADSRRRQRVA